jgi:hypothetical protein
MYDSLPRGRSLRSLVSRLRAEDKLLTSLNAEKLSKKRHEVLADAYEGETAYVLTCGPSMDEVWSEELRDFLEDKLVLAVKQTHHLAPEIVDIHLYNEVRVEEYDYPADTIRISVSNFVEDLPSHVHYPIRNYDWDDALFVTDEYEKWRLSESYERPWGVGIMFEIGLHLPVYLGVDRMLIMGFDMNAEGKYHFYDDSEDEDSEAYDVDQEEFYYAQRTIPEFMDWVTDEGVETRLHSPLSALDIPDVEHPIAWDRQR